MKQRCEVLDLPATDAELGLAAAVVADAVLGAVVVEVEQLAQAADARGLDVQHPRRERERANVIDGVDRRVPGDPRRGAAASSGAVSSVSAGSSIQASGKPSTTRR